MAGEQNAVEGDDELVAAVAACVAVESDGGGGLCVPM